MSSPATPMPTASESRPVPSMRSFAARISPMGRGLILLVALLLLIALACAPLFPSRVIAASAPAETFSAERAMQDLAVIAKEPHPDGSPAQAQVRDYLVGQLTGIGLDPEVQKIWGIENVVARLPGTDPSGAILVLAHYDSIAGPGAGDNGSGTAVLLETTRALTAGPALKNDVIVLFDDGEELPDAFTGSRAFAREHPWMEDVQVAISLDTAVNGSISTNEIGPENGFIVDALAQTRLPNAWSSMSGGGGYDSEPFKIAGKQILALESNYPIKEKHTAGDVVEIVNPGTVQQMGEQAVAILRVLGDKDLSNPRGTQKTWFPVPVVGLVHYPEAWAVPIAIAALGLLIVAFALALRRRLIAWRGIGVALLGIGISIALSAVVIAWLAKVTPKLMGWKTSTWPEWPEVVPPNMGLVGAVYALIVLGLCLAAYWLARRWSGGREFSLVGLLILAIPGVALSLLLPKAAYWATWPPLLGALVWIAAITVGQRRNPWSVDVTALLAAIPLIFLLFPLIPSIVMSDGTKSLVILAVFLALQFGIFLPAVDGLLGGRQSTGQAVS